MSQKSHQIVQNDVRYSALPSTADHATERTTSDATPRKRPASLRKPKAPPGLRTPPRDVAAAGLYRIRAVREGPAEVRVLSNGCSFFITEAEYRLWACEPHFDDLPWHQAPDEQPAGRKR